MWPKVWKSSLFYRSRSIRRTSYLRYCQGGKLRLLLWILSQNSAFTSSIAHDCDLQIRTIFFLNQIFKFIFDFENFDYEEEEILSPLPQICIHKLNQTWGRGLRN